MGNSLLQNTLWGTAMLAQEPNSRNAHLPGLPNRRCHRTTLPAFALASFSVRKIIPHPISSTWEPVKTKVLVIDWSSMRVIYTCDGHAVIGKREKRR